MRKLALLLIYFSRPLFGQDTLTISFDTNSAEISPYEQIGLAHIPTWYDIALIDSIHFIGYSDSTGKSNVAEHRAHHVYKACVHFLEPDTPFKIVTSSENSGFNSYGKVKIILFYAQASFALRAKKEILKTTGPTCFKVDFEALEYCHVTEFRMGKETYVQLEALNIPLFKERKHYYALPDTSGAKITRLNWQLKTTGRSWWKKERWVTIMPKESFSAFQFFTLVNAPCYGCADSLFNKDTVILTQLRSYPDLFLMDNMQAKIQVFGGTKMKIRAPKEYVNLYENYSFDSSPYGSTGNPIVWSEKKGPKKQNYYYSTLRNTISGPLYIKKTARTGTCLTKYEYAAYQRSWTNKGYVNPRGKQFVSLRIAPGTFFHNDTLTAFITAGIYIKGFCMNAGVNHRGGLYSSIYYNRGILSFAILPLNPKNKWQNLSQRPRTRRYLILYAGGDVRTSFTQKYWSFLEGNLHLGTRLWYFGSSSFRCDFFVQGGLAYDFSRRINAMPYAYAECGFHFDLPIVRN